MSCRSEAEAYPISKAYRRNKPPYLRAIEHGIFPHEHSQINKKHKQKRQSIGMKKHPDSDCLYFSPDTPFVCSVALHG